MAQIKLERISKRFGDIAVVRELDLTIKEGEFFTIVGPSGCGKSTLLNMIAGLEEASSGTIAFDGAVVNSLAPRERDVAMVFQSYALYPHMSVFENMAFPLRMQKAEKAAIAKEVRRVADLLGLGHLLDRRPRELSGGQRQRVALGRAIIRKPRVFLMDEPLSNLDARLRIETRAELKRLHQELRITTVYVTHDQSEAMSLSDRIAVLNEGAVQQVGTPLEVYRRPATLFVAGFIGSPPMNVLPCIVKSGAPPAVECKGAVLSKGPKGLSEGRKVDLGIRPEDLEVSSERSGSAVEATVSTIEPAGAVNWVDLEWKGLRMKGAARPDTALKAGDPAWILFSEEKMHFFDGETGVRISDE